MVVKLTKAKKFRVSHPILKNDLFKSLNPKYIVTYLGGNDLTLNYSAEKISQKIIEFFKKITERFPNTSIINLSIKIILQ